MSPSNRREFLRTLGAGVALAAGARLLPDCTDAASSDRGRLRVEGGTALVIGSGFGGSIAALRLAQAGIATTVLERGKRWPITPAGDTFCSQLAPDGRAAWFKSTSPLPVGPQTPIDAYAGVLDYVDAAGIRLFRGSAVGGTSVVYGGMTVQPRQVDLEKLLPKSIAWSELDEKWFPMARALIGVAKVPDDILSADFYGAARLAMAQAEAAGYVPTMIDQACDWDVVRAEMRGEKVASAIVGELAYGANSGYKRSLDRTVLADAEATGLVTVKPLHRVERVRQIVADGRELWTLDVDEIDEHGAVVVSHVFTADYLFVCAGPIGTSELLVKARGRGDLPALDARVGQGIGTNGNSMFMRSDITAPTGDMQASPPVVAIQDFDNAVAPMLVEQAPFPSGFDCGCLMGLAVVTSPSRGAFSYDADNDAVTFDFPTAEEAAHLTAAVTAHAGHLDDSAGGTLGSAFLPAPSTTFTYHPLGGAVIGQVCDTSGRVAGYDRLYCVDGALIPGSVGPANPSLTIAALALRCMHKILDEDLGVG